MAKPKKTAAKKKSAQPMGILLSADEPVVFRFEPEEEEEEWDEAAEEPGVEQAEPVELGPLPSELTVAGESAGQRLDAFLASQLPGVSRSRVQMLLDQGDILLNGATPRASLKLRGGEHIEIKGEPRPAPLKAIPEDIPLDVIFEDTHLAVINKPAGMMVHAGSGQNDDERSRGTLVNALLFRFKKLSGLGGELRPGIVHRLDKDTSGLIVVAKSDRVHTLLGNMFSERKMKKTYVALVQGALERPRGTINASISRDPVRRTRMTTSPNENARSAVSHYELLRAFEGRFGRFSLVKVRIETGRTHQIRVHMASIGHPVVGDTLYGGPGQVTDQVVANQFSSRTARRNNEPERLRLDRNFLHAAELEFEHPVSHKAMKLEAPLASELEEFLRRLEAEPAAKKS